MSNGVPTYSLNEFENELQVPYNFNIKQIDPTFGDGTLSETFVLPGIPAPSTSIEFLPKGGNRTQYPNNNISFLTTQIVDNKELVPDIFVKNLGYDTLNVDLIYEKDKLTNETNNDSFNVIPGKEERISFSFHEPYRNVLVNTEGKPLLYEYANILRGAITGTISLITNEQENRIINIPYAANRDSQNYPRATLLPEYHPIEKSIYTIVRGHLGTVLRISNYTKNYMRWWIVGSEGIDAGILVPRRFGLLTPITTTERGHPDQQPRSDYTAEGRSAYAQRYQYIYRSWYNDIMILRKTENAERNTHYITVYAETLNATEEDIAIDRAQESLPNVQDLQTNINTLRFTRGFEIK